MLESRISSVEGRNLKRVRGGFTFLEVLSGLVMLLGALLTLMAAMAGQSATIEHAQNLSLAVNDADRILEQLRLQNSEGICTTVDVAPPTGFATWDAWLGAAGGAGGKSMPRIL